MLNVVPKAWIGLSLPDSALIAQTACPCLLPLTAVSAPPAAQPWFRSPSFPQGAPTKSQSTLWKGFNPNIGKYKAMHICKVFNSHLLEGHTVGFPSVWDSQGRVWWSREGGSVQMPTGARWEGNKWRGWRGLGQRPGKDELLLSGVVEKMPCAWHELMHIKQEKRYRYSLQTHVHGGTHMSKYDFRACVEACTWGWGHGWRAGCSCEQAGSLVMPKRGNRDVRDDHSPALCQLYTRIREIWKTTQRYEWKTI